MPRGTSRKASVARAAPYRSSRSNSESSTHHPDQEPASDTANLLDHTGLESLVQLPPNPNLYATVFLDPEEVSLSLQDLSVQEQSRVDVASEDSDPGEDAFLDTQERLQPEEPEGRTPNSSLTLSQHGYDTPGAAKMAEEFTTAQSKFGAAYAVCQGMAIKMPATKHTLSEAKRTLVEVKEYLQTIKDMVGKPRIGMDVAQAQQFEKTLQEFLGQAAPEVITLEGTIDKIASPEDAQRALEQQLAKSKGKSERKFLAKKVTAVNEALTKLDTAINEHAVGGGPVPKERAEYFSNQLERHRKFIENELQESVAKIEAKDPEMDEADRDEMLGHELTLQATLDKCLNSLSLRELPESVYNAPLNNSAVGTTAQSPNVSVVTQAPSNAGAPRHGYKPYKSEDYPRFDGDFTEYAAWKDEWVEWIIPGNSEVWVLRNMDRLTPEEDDLRIYSTVTEAWAHLDQKYANSLVVSNEVIDVFISTKPSDITGRTDEIKLQVLRNGILRLRKQLAGVGEEHQLTENMVSVRQILKLIPPSYAKTWATSPEAQEVANVRSLSGNKDVAKIHYSKIMGYIERILMSIHQNASWLLQTEESGKKGGKSVKRVCFFSKEGQPKPDDNSNSNRPNDGRKPPPKNGQVSDKVKADQNKYGPCPLCKKGHTFQGRYGIQASSKVQDCKEFTKLSDADKARVCVQKKICVRCLSWLHQRDSCPYEHYVCGYKTDGEKCGKPHHRQLHKCGDPKIINLVHSDHPATYDILPAVVEIEPKPGVKLLALLDPGSNSSLITFNGTRKCKLKGSACVEYVKVAGHDVEERDTFSYNLPLEVDGKMRNVLCMGIQTITENYGPENIEEAYKLFPQYTNGELNRPLGDAIDVLIGLDQADLLPRGGLDDDACGQLLVMSTPLSKTGKVLMGHHPNLAISKAYRFTPAAINAMKTEFIDRKGSSSFSAPKSINFRRCNNLSTIPNPDVQDLAQLEDVEPLPGQPQDFILAEQLGVMVPRLCNSCATCLRCVIQEGGPTVKEQLELKMMEDGMRYDPDILRMVVTYPLVGETGGFSINYQQALSRAKSLYRSLTTKGALEAYNTQVKDYLQRGVWRPTTWEAIHQHASTGKIVHFVAHNGIVNQTSLSTKLRIVVDSAIRNPGNNKSINEAWVKGPCTLNPLYETLVTFRSFPVACVYDLSKAYHQIKTTEDEFFQRLCVWKLSEDEDWQVYGTDCVGMGDGPAGGFLDLTLNAAADMAKDDDPKAALDAKKSRYADDTLGGGTREECEKMRGEVSFSEDGKMATTGTVQQMLRPVSFKPKVIVLSGDTDQRILDLFGGKVLGQTWDPTTDRFIFKFTINLPTKVRGRKVKGDDLSLADIEDIKKLRMSRRNCLAISHQLYDPYGLVSTYLIKFKIRMRRLIILDLDWDEDIPEEENTWWLDNMIATIEAEPLLFPRSIWSDQVTGRPELIAFFDGSDLAYGCLIYARWPTASESFAVTLLTSKARVTPRAGCTTPRAELSALVLTTRLLVKVVPSLSTKPVRLSILGDSTCTIAACQLDVTGMKPFFSNRTLEIQTTLSSIGEASKTPMFQELDRDEAASPDTELQVDLLYHIEGKSNPADWPSRGNLEWEQMGLGSEYQDGPGFLKQDRSTWDNILTRDFVKQIPDTETKVQFHNVMAHMVKEIKTPGIKILIDISYKYDKLSKVKGIFARLAQAARLDDTSKINETPDVEDYTMAMYWLALLSRDDTAKLIAKGQGYLGLSPRLFRGLYISQGRVGTRSMKRALGHEYLIILANTSRLAFLLMSQAHAEDHRQSNADALHRTRRMGYWIVRGRNLSTKVTKACNFCKIARKETEAQRMGLLPDIRTTPSHPFSAVSVDYMGPMDVYDSIKKRTKMKAYPIIISCATSGAYHMELAKTYDAEEFLVSWSRFTALRGCPYYAYTDMGSNLVCASGTSKDFRKLEAENKKRWEAVKSSCAKDGTQWRHAPSGGQHRDPSEAGVKAIKKTLKHLLNPGTLTYDELLTVLTRAADLVNQRPLGIAHQNDAEPEGTIITPNTLLKNQRTDHFNVPDEDELNPSTDEDQRKAYSKRMTFQDQIIKEWWNTWYTTVFSTLIPYRSWRTAKRNVRPGDVGLLKFNKKVAAADYRMCRVAEVIHDPEDGLVRTVVVKVPPSARRMITYPDPKKKLKMVSMTVPIQRLCIFLPAEEQADPLSDL